VSIRYLYTGILNSILSEKQLKDFVVPRIAYMWKNVCFQLKFSSDDLAKIDKNYKREPVEECCKDKNVKVSGAKLVKAIKDAGNARYASEGENLHLYIGFVTINNNRTKIL